MRRSILVDARTNSLSPYHFTETRLSIVQTTSAMATHTAGLTLVFQYCMIVETAEYSVQTSITPP